MDKKIEKLEKEKIKNDLRIKAMKSIVNGRRKFQSNIIP
jgi:hypothetical protein